jgi:hypothetical protein
MKQKEKRKKRFIKKQKCDPSKVEENASRKKKFLIKTL